MNKTFVEIDYHLLNDEQPSYFLNTLLDNDALSEWPFTMLQDLVGVPQSPQHHPEGDVWNHTCLVVNEAAKRRVISRNPRSLMWAALLHDLGKPSTTRVRKNGRVTAYDHDREGEKLARQFLESLTDDRKLIEEVARLVRWHMQLLFVVRELPFADIPTMVSQVDLDEIALLGLCDRLGRGELSPEIAAAEINNVNCFIERCREFVN